jgi:hypothetical protein
MTTYLKVLCQHQPEGTEEEHEKYSRTAISTSQFPIQNFPNVIYCFTSSVNTNMVYEM